jgi:hypothetical protein
VNEGHYPFKGPFLLGSMTGRNIGSDCINKGGQWNLVKLNIDRKAFFLYACHPFPAPFIFLPEDGGSKSL